MRPRPGPNVETNWPTPDEISECTARIRRTWSAHRFRVRARLSPELNAVEIAVVTPGALDGRYGSLEFN